MVNKHQRRKGKNVISKEQAGYRVLLQRNTCDNCDNKAHYHTQGWSLCTEIDDHLLTWGKMKDSVCDQWKEIPEKTTKEKAMEKLSHQQKVDLGLI